MLAGRIGFDRLLLKVPEDPFNHHGVFDTGNHFDLTAAVFADFNVDIEYPFESLHRGHGTMALFATLIVPVGIGCFWFVRLFPTLGGCHLNPVLDVGGKGSVVSSEIDFG